MTSDRETTWPEYFRKLQAYLEWQTGQIAELRNAVGTLRSELATVKEQKGVRIDKIEYNFDQLKVERLEGTLNIGVTPSGLQSLEDFAVGGQTASFGAKDGHDIGAGPFPSGDGSAGGPGKGPSQGPEQGTDAPYRNSGGGAGGGWATNWITDISNQVKTYLDEDIAHDLEEWAKTLNLPLDSESQRLVLQDIRAQLDDRVLHYARETGNRAVAGQSFESMAQDIIERTKRDIRTAIEMYISGMRPKEEDA